MAATVGSDSGLEEVTSEDVRIFKNTLLARRFPGLKNMPDEDIRQMILVDRKATGRKLEAGVKTYPKTQPGPPAGRPEPGLIFKPVNPFSAKDMVARTTDELFLSKHTRYDAAHAQFLEDLHTDAAKRCANASFWPTSSTQAKDTIRVDYYLNSKTAEGKQEELLETRRRAGENMQQYNTLASTRRGKTLI